MANIFNVAQHILQKSGEMSAWRLQNLCYYAQAWVLAQTGEPLFAEDFEAWSNGPVCRSVYRLIKNSPAVLPDDIPGDTQGNDFISEEQANIIDHMLERYGKYQLFEFAKEHSKDHSPWKIGRGSRPNGVLCGDIILKENILNYFGQAIG